MKVCFFSPTAYAYFEPSSDSWAGGAETQQVLLARHMVHRGVDVSFIVGDHGQPEVERHGEITVIKSFRPFAGNRKLRFVPDMLKIRRAMRIADADVYNQRSTSFYTGQIAWFAARLGRVFTFSLGIDYNCYPDCDGRLPPPMAALYRYGIRRADAIIAQTDFQRRLVLRNFERNAVLIPNGIPIPGEPPGPGQANPPDFLWVGSFRRRKRPELFVELARRVPDARFVMAGGAGDDPPFFEEVRARMATVSNLEYAGFVPPGEIDALYRSAYAYVNTSTLEGFPNTYLHSWVHGVPTLTVEIDPDDIITNHRLGVRAGDFETLVTAVRELAGDPARRERLSENARRYVLANHDIRDRGDDYICLFEELSRRRSSRRSSRSG
ncbi:MAG TPA: glycosyltransferase family 1 protein [Alphaproteobacteria bacterium]|nr:glycosyltransferase family 1 protein [Alphaproteobacteria bacterium]